MSKPCMYANEREKKVEQSKYAQKKNSQEKKNPKNRTSSREKQ